MISRIRINKSEGGFSSIERTHKRLPAAALLKVADARASLTALASSERERDLAAPLLSTWAPLALVVGLFFKHCRRRCRCRS